MAHAGNPRRAVPPAPGAELISSLSSLAPQFTRAARLEKRRLLATLATTPVGEGAHLVRLHETLCFLQAYPDDREVLDRVDGLLRELPRRILALGPRGQARLRDTGIAGSTLHPNAPPPTNAPTVAGGGPQVSKMTVVTPGKLKQGPEGPNAPTHAATVGAGKGAVPAPPALEDQVAYQYNALGRRDPFNSLLEGAFVGDDVGGDAPPDLGGLKVVGIMWGDRDQFAMVEDIKGNSYVLRRGDKVMNGVVQDLKRDAMVINITVDGQSQSVTVPITRKGEKSNANR